VRLKPSLREEIAPVSGTVADSLIRQNTNEDDDEFTPTPVTVQRQPEPEKKPGFFQRLFGKKDTTKRDEFEVDTVGKTKKEIRQEKRALKKLERQREKEMRDKGLM
jgi:hypothetical protein